MFSKKGVFDAAVKACTAGEHKQPVINEQLCVWQNQLKPICAFSSLF
jgi:hypothetical protein